jgi:hypothetical protein
LLSRESNLPIMLRFRLLQVGGYPATNCRPMSDHCFFMGRGGEVFDDVVCSGGRLDGPHGSTVRPTSITERPQGHDGPEERDNNELSHTDPPD